MKEYFCWRCKRIVPMLEEDEWSLISPHLQMDVENIKKYRIEKNASLDEAVKNVPSLAVAKYEELTGSSEVERGAIWHHRLKDYGDECYKCGHLLRTPRASYCANCGALKKV